VKRSTGREVHSVYTACQVQTVSASSCLFSKTAGHSSMSFHSRLPLVTQNTVTLSEEQRLKPEFQNLWLIIN